MPATNGEHEGVHSQVEEESKILSKKHGPNAPMVEEEKGNVKSDVSFVQAHGLGHPRGGSRSGGAATYAPSADGQASGQKSSVHPGIDDPLHRQQGRPGENPQNPGGDKTSLTPRRDKIFKNYQQQVWKTAVEMSATKHIHTFTRRAHDTKLPSKTQLHNVPIHSAEVNSMFLERVVELMSPSHKKRFNELIELTFENIKQKLDLKKAKGLQQQEDEKYNNNISSASSSPGEINNNNINNFNNQELYQNGFVKKRSNLLPQHGARLVKDKIASRVPNDQRNDSQAFCIPFFVVEEKDGKERLRFICWTEEINNMLEDDYTPQMSQLQHSSRFVDAVRDECAATGDLKISFFQVEIPEKYRKYFRFFDVADDLYEMNRLPMGLKTSAEIMQLIVETLAGVPSAVKPSAYINGEKVSLCNKRLTTRVWIDGFQSSGPRAECEAAAERIRKVGAWCGVTWKDGVKVEDKYDFIGIHFDHNIHRVTVAEKTLKKLPLHYNSKKQVNVTQLEKDISRLFFCSGVLRIIPAHFYYSIKWVNRQIAKLNKEGDDFAVTLPPSVVTALNSWLEKSKSFLELPPTTTTKSSASSEFNNNNNNSSSSSASKRQTFDILFTDASITGWGAFFITPTGEVAIIGGKWPPEMDASSKTIAYLEARAAFLALTHFKQRLLRNKNVDIRIDNSSVGCGLIKGKAKDSPQLNEDLKPSLDWLVSHDFCYSIKHVDTKENWADGPSRGSVDPKLLRLTRTEVSTINENRGSLGRQAANAFVHQNNHE